MEHRIAVLESAVEDLRQTVLTMQQRLDAIAVPVGAAAAVLALTQVPSEVEAQLVPARSKVKDPYDPIAILSLVGRLLLVLAGGFFLRAMTDAGTLAVPVGISCAFAYAAVWLFLSDRAGGQGQLPNAVSHALAAALLAFPLIVEATTRFKVLTGLGGAIALSVASAALLYVAWRRRLRAVAWLTVIGALPTSAAILVQTGVVVPFALYLVAFGLATLWLGYAIDGWGGRWLAAVAADMAVVGVTMRAFAPEHLDTPQVAMLLQLLLLVVYLGSIAIRTLVRRHDVTVFEAAQVAAALAVSLAGAVFMERATDGVPAALGVAALLVGAACYAAAVMVVGKGEGTMLNFHFYASLALVLVLAGFAIAIDGAWAGAAFALLAVAAIGLWSRQGQLFLLAHGAVYLVAAGVVAGSFSYGVRTLVAGAEGSWEMPDAVMLFVLVASALSAGLAAMRTPLRGDELATGTRFVIVMVFVWIAAGSLTGYIAPLAGLANQDVDAGVLATVRTGVLSLATLAIAWVGGHARLREWGWLVYPLLIGIGLKLMTQDFKHSRPSTLFIALALYGAALIIAPRLRRRVEKTGSTAVV